MKAIFVILLAAATLAGGAESDTKPQATGCAGCAKKAPAEAVTTRTVPGTSESMPVGRVENLIPIGVLAVLGCEPCTGEAVGWALQQGSSTEDVERALNTVDAMAKLDCFKQQFGPDAAARLEKPLAAARKVLQQAIDRGGR